MNLLLYGVQLTFPPGFSTPRLFLCLLGFREARIPETLIFLRVFGIILVERPLITMSRRILSEKHEPLPAGSRGVARQHTACPSRAQTAMFEPPLPYQPCLSSCSCRGLSAQRRW